jgi:hypothetical protein
MAARPVRARRRSFVGQDEAPARCRDCDRGEGCVLVAVVGDDRAGVVVPERDLPRPGGLDRPRAIVCAVAAAVGLGLTLGPTGLSPPDLGRVVAAAVAAAAAASLADAGGATAPSPGRRLTRWLIGVQVAAFVGLVLEAPALATGTAALWGLLPIELLGALRRRQEAVGRLPRSSVVGLSSRAGGSRSR